jgi:hypothetical protein
MGTAVVGALIAAAALVVMPTVATPPSGMTTTLLAPVTPFDAIDAKVKTGDWKSEIRTRDPRTSTSYRTRSRPAGPPAGTVTLGQAWSSSCPGRRRSTWATTPPARRRWCRPGSGFVDQGGEVHIVRNEGSVDLVTVVVSLVPAGAGKTHGRAGPRQLPLLRRRGEHMKRCSRRVLAATGVAAVAHRIDFHPGRACSNQPAKCTTSGTNKASLWCT